MKRYTSALAERATLTPADYLARLKDERRRLKELDPVMASLALSDALLPDNLRPCWYALAVFPADFDVAAAAAVWDMKPDDAHDALDTLHRYSVLEWNDQARRFHLHDLVRLFDSQCLPAAQRQAAERRYAEHFEAILRTADQSYQKGGAGITSGLALFDLERHNIVVGQIWAAAHAENDNVAARLASDYPDAGVHVLDLRLYPRDKIAWLQTAIAAARAHSDREGEAYHLSYLGLAYTDLGQPRKAIECYEQLLVIARAIRDRRAEAIALGSLRLAHADLDRPRKGIKLPEYLYAMSRAGARTAPNDPNLARAARRDTAMRIAACGPHFNLAALADRHAKGNTVGDPRPAHADLRDSRKAIEYYEHELTIARKIGDRRGEGNALGNLANAYVALGDPRKVTEYYGEALAIAREIGDRLSEANVCWNMGDEYAKAADLVRAADLMQVCVDYEREIGHPDAEKHAARVAALRARLK